MELIIIVIFFWVLTGLQAAAPFVNSHMLKWYGVIVFIILGPCIALGNIVNTIMAYFTEDDDDGQFL